jgi:hypothetical protein
MGPVDWDRDQPRVKTVVQEEFGFHIDGINYQKGTARIIGNVGLTIWRSVSATALKLRR